MSKRMLDTSIWANEHFADLPPMGRLLLIGIITLADDQGRCKANPAYLRSQVFPYDDLDTADVDAWLHQLSDNETVLLYHANGKAYLQMCNWWSYQPLDWARPSEHPAPDGWQDRIRYNAKGAGHLTYNWSTKAGSILPDTCDSKGQPLGLTTRIGTPVPAQVPTEVPTPPRNADKLDQTKLDQTREGDRARVTDRETGAERHDVRVAIASEPEPQISPPPENYSRMAEQSNGHNTHYRSRSQLNADVYLEQARKLGIEPPAFSARITALAGAVGKRSYIDAADDDAGTLNAIKGGVITLAKLGHHTEADYRALCEQFAESNQWMDSPVPTLRQLVDFAGKLKDGVVGKAAPPRNRLPKVNAQGYYDFPDMASWKAALAANPDIAKRCSVKGTKV